MQVCQQQQQQQLFSSNQAAAARQQRALAQLPHALKDEEAEIDRITKEAAQSDIWGNEVVGNAVKVGSASTMHSSCRPAPPRCLVKCVSVVAMVATRASTLKAST